MTAFPRVFQLSHWFYDWATFNNWTYDQKTLLDHTFYIGFSFSYNMFFPLE